MHACAHAQDVARLARWMAGKAVGLVLSGGGSRGLAHLGVLHALDDAGVPIDVIGGTSQVGKCLLVSPPVLLSRTHPQFQAPPMHLLACCQPARLCMHGKLRMARAA
jgi:hypothetical protein